MQQSVRGGAKKGTEHFWATDIERRDGKTMGTINNDPNIVASVKLGDRIEIPEADVSDWLYMREGKDGRQPNPLAALEGDAGEGSSGL